MSARPGFLHDLCASLAMLALLTGCGGGDDDPPPPPTPSSISYSTPQVTVVGTAVNLTPTVSGSPGSYTVSPALPAGLALNATTGVISGTPTTVTPQATYTVSATASAGTITFALTLTVNPAAPSALSYTTPLTLTAGTAIATTTPAVTGVVTGYTVNPALPAGLALNATSGAITGTPTTASAMATYMVTASNVTGSTTFNLQIAVNAAAQTASGVFIDSVVSGLAYSSGTQSGVTDENGEFTYEIGQPVTFKVGDVTLGSAPGKSAMTPLDLVPGSHASTLEVVNIVRFLMLMDSDGDAANGISISPALRARAENWPAVDFTTADLADALATIIPDTAADGTVRQLATASTAQTHFEATFRCAMSGYFRGTFDGDDHGFFAFTIHPNGVMAGATYSLAEDELLPLLFQPQLLTVQNDAALVAGLAATGSSFTGQLHGADEVSGTWTEGTFAGSRYAGTSTAAYKFIAVLRLGNASVGSVLLEIDNVDKVTLTPHVDFRTNVNGPTLSAALEGGQLSVTSNVGTLDVTIDKSALTLSGGWSNTVNGTSGTLVGLGCRLK